MRWILFVVAAATGCGDNLDPPQRCDVPAAELPTEGDYIDPYAFPLPAECIDGGLDELPGRWFVRDPAAEFLFEYPRIGGSCEAGFHRVSSAPDDHDDSDGATLFTWSDGTRFFRREETHYKLPDGSAYRYIRASVMCVLPDDQVAAAYVEGERVGTLEPAYAEWNAIGTRFALADDPAAGLELVGELPRTVDGRVIFAVNLVVEDGYAYVAAFTGFEIIDVRDPSHPVHAGHLNGSYNDVRLASAWGSRFAILAPAGGGRTLVIDVTNPAFPQVASVIDLYSHSLFVQQRGATTELYLAGNVDIPTFDITLPWAPVAKPSVKLKGQETTHDLFVKDDMLYVNQSNAGFVAVDVSAGTNAPVEVARVPTSFSHASWLGTAGGRTILLHGDEGMTGTSDGGAFLRVFEGDRASPKYMTEIGRYRTRPEVGIHNIELHGDLAYIAYYQDGVRIVDLSDPTAPVEVAHYNTWDVENAYGDPFEGAVGIRLVDGLIYVADDQRGLMILRQTP